MATVRVRIVNLTVRITLSVCPFNRMAHTANSHYHCWRSYIRQYSKSCFEVGKEVFGLVLCKRVHGNQICMEKTSNVKYIKVNCTFNLNCHGTLQYSLRSSLTKY
jgi:hypothetical protein